MIESILKMKSDCGYGEDFMFNAWFEGGGLRGEEIEEQMHVFAEEVMPVLRRECGGGPQWKESEVALDPTAG